MKRVIKIGRPYIIDIGDFSKLCCDIFFDEWEAPKKIYFMTDVKYKEYLCFERSDAFLIAILGYSLSHSSHDNPITIICDAPISSELNYLLTNHYIPALSKYVSWCNEVIIKGEVDCSILGKPFAVGTSVSGGVDSFYSIYKQKNTNDDSFKPTHGIFLDTESYEKKYGDSYLSLIKDICVDSGIELVSVRSNVCEEVYKVFHANIVNYVVCPIVFALQKMFKVFYYSSDYSYNDFCFNDTSCADYILFSSYALRTENTCMFVSGGDAERHEKTDYIADYVSPRKRLLVCRNPRIIDGKISNCSKCSKCTRTIIDLDIHGKLELFKDVFDVDYYLKHKTYYWGYLFFKGKKDLYTKQSFNIAKKTGYKIPLFSRISGLLKIIKNGFKRSNKLKYDYRP